MNWAKLLSAPAREREREGKSERERRGREGGWEGKRENLRVFWFYSVISVFTDVGRYRR